MLELIVSQLSASLVMVTAGTAYLFSMYGIQLASILGLTQTEISFAAACCNAGNYLGGPLVGYLVDLYPESTSAFFLFGGLAISTGYFVLGLLAARELNFSYLIISGLYFLIGMGTASSYHCALATNYRNWPESTRSLAVGFTVSFFGLSAFIYTELGKAFFVQDELLQVSDFLIFIGATCLILNLFAVLTLKKIKPTFAVTFDGPDEAERLLTNGLAYDACENDFQEYTEEREEREERMRSLIRNQSPHSIISSSVPHSELGLNVGEMEPGIELMPTSCFLSVNAYLLGFNMFAVVGVGLMYINNVGSIVLSMLPLENSSGDADVQALQQEHVGLLSLASFLARISIGILADVGLRFGVSKTIWALFSSIMMTLALVIGLYLKRIDDLIYVTLSVAIAYGATWTTIPILVGEFFSISNFSNNWGWMTAIPAFGGQFFGMAFGYYYEHASKDGKCRGPICVKESFLLSLGFCAACIIGNLILHLKRRS